MFSKTVFLFFFFLSWQLFSEKAETAENSLFQPGIVLNFYNEPALKPGYTLGLDWEFFPAGKWRMGVTLPTVGYFYFPHNYEAYYLYPELSLRYIGRRGFYFSLGGASGLSLSRKVVPVYNLEGEEITDSFTKQLVLMAQAYFGMDFSRRSRPKPFRIYCSLGWKGLYPNNLGFQNQPMMQLGINYKLRGSYE